MDCFVFNFPKNSMMLNDNSKRWLNQSYGIDILNEMPIVQVNICKPDALASCIIIGSII